MKAVKIFILETALLLAMLVCGTVTMKVLDVALSLGSGNIFLQGAQAGFVAWLVVSLLIWCVQAAKGKKSKE